MRNRQFRRWWPPIVGLPAAVLLLGATLTAAVPAHKLSDAGTALTGIPDTFTDMFYEGRSLAGLTWQAATDTQPSCPPPVIDSALPAPAAELRPGIAHRSVGVHVTHATCVAVTVHQRGPDLHHAWDGLLPTIRHTRTKWVSTRKSQTLPVTVTAVGPGGTTVTTGELLVAKASNAR